MSDHVEYLDFIESKLPFWRSLSTEDVRNERNFDLLLATYEQVWDGIEVILKYWGHDEEVKERAMRLRREISSDCKGLLKKRTDALIPLEECVESMEVKRTSSSRGSEIERESCVVCMEEFGVSGVEARVTECAHYFHFNCIFKWFQSNPCCPLCRVKLCDY
ncbi:hypothetical protein Scep_020442 [Stephania cephalantha]|uniref:RING-type domain-containing protein n=1 Tax=Stephania cephalantha TaxID=152367 RepID=A0AAP0ID67_9MAGN